MIHTAEVRLGTTTEWADADASDNEAAPVLAIGEVGIDVTKGQIKVGDGSTAFASLRSLRPSKITLVTLSGGTATTADTSITAATVIIPVVKTLGTVAAAKVITVTRSVGVSFTLTSSDGTDTSVIQTIIYEP